MELWSTQLELFFLESHELSWESGTSSVDLAMSEGDLSLRLSRSDQEALGLSRCSVIRRVTPTDTPQVSRA